MATEIRVSIAVYVGEPLDFQKYRHTAMYFQFRDGAAPILIHAIGPPQEYEVVTRENYDPSKSARLAREVEVGWLEKPMTRPQLIAFAFESQPENHNREYNCHSWVEAVLRHLRDAGYISAQTYQDSFDSMIEITLEAADE